MSKLGGFELLAQDAADEAYRNVMMLRDSAVGDSPIEKLFFAALVTIAGQCGRSMQDVMRIDAKYPLVEARYGVRIMGQPHKTIYLERQVEVAGWRVDFVLHYPAVKRDYDENNDPSLDRMIVECDGHAYHERTKQQAARDRARDRLAIYEGIPVFRFTGSEIWNDPMACADEVLQFMERA